MNLSKQKVLIFTDWYIPGYKAGGPIQSLRNMVAELKDDIEFYVVTSDRDLGDHKPYAGIVPNMWQFGKSGEFIYYAKDSKLTILNIRRIIRDIKPDAIYLNSMFSFHFTILPLIALKFTSSHLQLVLAPRGMLHKGALSLKPTKKKIFFKLFELLRLQKNIRFHATDITELNDIKTLFTTHDIALIENIPANNIACSDHHIKKAGLLKIVFYSRIHKKKNLHYILDILQKSTFKGQLELDVYGEADSHSYLDACVKISKQLPHGTTVKFFRGGPASQMIRNLSLYDAFILPTLGENFGHAIFEALMSGVPVVISDQTPWRNLAQQQAGWDIPLDQPDTYRSVLQHLIDMDDTTHKQWRAGARHAAERYIANAEHRNKYLTLFHGH